MEAVDVEENLFVAGDAKLHGGICRALYGNVRKVLEIFPFIEAARPRSKSGIQALCSLHVALDRAKGLLQHCADCSKLYLAITSESILMKFDKARCTLMESLRRVEGIVSEDIGCQVMDIAAELEEIILILDQSEKEAGDEIINLLQRSRQSDSTSNDSEELEVFHQAASRLGISSSRAALTERRALKKLIERARAEEDKRKESVVSYLYHLMRKYSKLFRSEVADDTDSQGSTPCSPSIIGSEDICGYRNGRAFERHLSKLQSFNFSLGNTRYRNMPIPPEELRCPISLQLMYDPVIISSGQTYERVCIEKWLNNGHSTCPKSQQQLSHLGLTPNYCVKGLIASWCEQNGVTVPDGPPESLDVNWAPAFSDCETMDSRSMESINSSKVKGVKVVPLAESCRTEELKGNEEGTLEDGSCHSLDDMGRYDSLLTVLHEGKSLHKQYKVVEQIRYLLKDDEEARIYMGANGFAEALVQFLRLAIHDGDDRAQEVGAMALFNLAVNNNRNKCLLLSAGVIDLLENMISNSHMHESATALYLNLSCLDDAKPIIGSSQAVTFLVQILHTDDPESSTCRHDALYTLYNLSSHPANIPSLLSSGIIDGLHSLLTIPSETESLNWVEKALAVLINLASTQAGRKEILSLPGLVGALAMLLDTSEPSEQEQAVACLLLMCTGDERCIHMVLQEGVVPSLVSISVNGTTRGKEKAQNLLKLFREHRQREHSPMRQQELQVESGYGHNGMIRESRPMCKSRSKKLSRTLSSMWKNRSFSVYQC
ncbi:U-box domain-containing protein 45-like [Typha latifolia]|uniref:U-box domain-containing protein 45-like n=1 Tax=Typha latifolia TaxID=4733 RepID=UPI003C2AF3D0